MPLRTCVKPVGTLTVKSLREQKMTDDHETHVKLHMQALANSMMQTKETLMANIFKDVYEQHTFENEYIVKVDFND